MKHIMKSGNQQVPVLIPPRVIIQKAVPACWLDYALAKDLPIEPFSDTEMQKLEKGSNLVTLKIHFLDE